MGTNYLARQDKMNQMEVHYFYSEDIGQPEVYQKLQSEYPQVNFTIQLIQKTDLTEIEKHSLLALPCLRFIGESNTQVLQLYGDQSELEIRTIIKEHL